MTTCATALDVASHADRERDRSVRVADHPRVRVRAGRCSARRAVSPSSRRRRSRSPVTTGRRTESPRATNLFHRLGGTLEQTDREQAVGVGGNGDVAPQCGVSKLGAGSRAHAVAIGLGTACSPKTRWNGQVNIATCSRAAQKSCDDTLKSPIGVTEQLSHLWQKVAGILACLRRGNGRLHGSDLLPLFAAAAHSRPK
jgi:hypothetical protein